MNSRRQTYATSGSSAIPVPSSSHKPVNTMRQSMVPTTAGNNANHRVSQIHRSTSNGQMRQSIAPPAHSQDFGASSQGSQLFSQGHGGPAAAMIAPSTVGRQSTYSSQQQMAGAMSVGRQGTLMRSSNVAPQQQQPYAPPSERRSSAFRRSTIGQGQQLPQQGTVSTPGGIRGSSTLLKPKIDPREAKKKSSEVRKQWAAEIVEFMLDLDQCPSVPFNLDEKVLLAPTGTQWQSIFKALIGAFDPSITFEGKPFNDLVPLILNEINYPFPSSITKSHLQSAGSQQSWPGMLAMLHWIVTTIKESDMAFEEAHELKMPDFDEAKERGEDLVPHAWFDYVASIYPKFLVEDDFDKEAEKDLFYIRVNDERVAAAGRVKALEAEKAALEAEWQEMQRHPDPLIALEDMIKKQKNDEISCQRYAAKLTERYQKFKAEKKAIEAEIESLTERNRASVEEIAQLKKIVDSQAMSQAEIHQTTEERKQLDDQTKEVRSKIEKILDRTMKQEIEVEKHLSLAKKFAEEYSNIVTPLGLLSGQPVEGYEGIDFNQEINPASNNPAPDCVSSIKPALQKMKVETRQKLRVVDEEDVTVREELSKQREKYDEVKDEQDEVKRESSQLTEVKERYEESASIELSALYSSIESLHSAVNHLSSTMQQPLRYAEWRLEHRSLELAQVNKESQERLQDNSTKFENALSKLLGHKEECVKTISKGLVLVEESKRTWPAPPLKDMSNKLMGGGDF